eukprot:752196-Hanusia_phi.AAC.1
MSSASGKGSWYCPPCTPPPTPDDSLPYIFCIYPYLLWNFPTNLDLKYPPIVTPTRRLPTQCYTHPVNLHQSPLPLRGSVKMTLDLGP